MTCKISPCKSLSAEVSTENDFELRDLDFQRGEVIIVRYLLVCVYLPKGGDIYNEDFLTSGDAHIVAVAVRAELTGNCIHLKNVTFLRW